MEGSLINLWLIALSNHNIHKGLMFGYLVNDELKIIWKKAFVLYLFKVVLAYFTTLIYNRASNVKIFAE